MSLNRSQSGPRSKTTRKSSCTLRRLCARAHMLSSWRLRRCTSWINISCVIARSSVSGGFVLPGLHLIRLSYETHPLARYPALPSNDWSDSLCYMLRRWPRQYLLLGVRRASLLSSERYFFPPNVRTTARVPNSADKARSRNSMPRSRTGVESRHIHGADHWAGGSESIGNVYLTTNAPDLVVFSTTEGSLGPWSVVRPSNGFIAFRRRSDGNYELVSVMAPLRWGEVPNQRRY